MRLRNKEKPRQNLTRISKYLHIVIFEYLLPKEIFKLSSVSRSIRKASSEDGVWEKHFPNQERFNKLFS
jgi:WD40 repeat protein